MGGNFFNLDYLLGPGLRTALNNPWAPWAGMAGLALSDMVPAVYRRLKQGFSKTKTGITNQTKVYGKGKPYYKYRYKFYKWISNGYRYKRDWLIQMYVKDSGTKVVFKTVGATTEHEVFMDVLNVAATQVNKFKEMFNEFHMCGIVIQFKPYQVVKTDTNDTNQIPNLLFAVLTQNEYTVFGSSILQDSDTIQKLTDRPFSKIIAADDDLRIYRPFKLKPSYGSGEGVLNKWVNTNDQGTNVYLVCLLCPSYQSARVGQWNIGTLKMTLYYKFRNSKL